MDQVDKLVDSLINDYSRAEAENVILRTRVKVLEEMLFGEKNPNDIIEQEAIGTMKYGEMSD